MPPLSSPWWQASLLEERLDSGLELALRPTKEAFIAHFDQTEASLLEASRNLG
jgi:hypothetical protein